MEDNSSKCANCGHSAKQDWKQGLYTTKINYESNINISRASKRKSEVEKISNTSEDDKALGEIAPNTLEDSKALDEAAPDTSEDDKALGEIASDTLEDDKASGEVASDAIETNASETVISESDTAQSTTEPLEEQTDNEEQTDLEDQTDIEEQADLEELKEQTEIEEQTDIETTPPEGENKKRKLSGFTKGLLITIASILIIAALTAFGYFANKLVLSHYKSWDEMINIFLGLK